MDMKKILQAIDSPSTASQPASDDMKKLMSIVTESKDNRLNAAESLIMQHYTHVDRPAPKKAVPSLISKYVEAVEQDRAELTEERLQESYALSQRVMEKMYPNAYFGKSGKFRHHIDRTHSISNSVWQSAKHSSDRMIGEDDEVDTVTIDIPLMIRLLEYAREDAKTDMDLHNVAEMLINLSKENEVLSMDHYDAIVGDQKALPAPDDVAEGIENVCKVCGQTPCNCTHISEVSNELLGKYKKAASADATKADAEGNFERGNKRFSGIVKATKKQFANDAKNRKNSP